MKTQITVLLCFFFFNLTAQKFEPCLIEKQDGTRIHGFARMPDPQAKQVQYKNDEDGDKEVLPSDDLKRVVLYDKDTVEFSREDIVHQGKKRGRMWLQKHISGFCSLYTMGGGSVMVRSGAFTSNKTTFTFYVKREGEPGATPIGSYIAGAINVRANAPFVKATSEYFKDYPELVARIKNKEFKLLECPAVILAYNDWKNKQ